MEPLRGAGEMPLVGHGHEVLELPEIDPVNLSKFSIDRSTRRSVHTINTLMSFD
jgi:hypothetical protein